MVLSISQNLYTRGGLCLSEYICTSSELQKLQTCVKFLRSGDFASPSSMEGLNRFACTENEVLNGSIFRKKEIIIPSAFYTVK